jgi:aldehyde dehydrogenase (NAD+)
MSANEHGEYDASLTFALYQPTRVLFGDGCLAELGRVCQRLGIERALLVTDRALRDQTDVVGRVERALGHRLGAIYDGVTPDGGAHLIDDGAAVGREDGCDGLVAVGGGSVIDCAKGIAIVLTEGGSIRDRQGASRLERRQTPHIAIPTTAGTGSEVSRQLVVRDHATHTTQQLEDDRIIPDAALLDPSVTLAMPAQLTAATGLDALTHAVEAFTSRQRNPVADGLALEALRLIARWLPVACEDGQNRAARGQMLLGAHMAGLACASAGLGLAHAMAHVLGARHGVHHGTANAICLPHVIRFNADALGARYRCVAEALGVAASALGDALVGEAAAQAVAHLLARLKLPARLRDVGVPEAALPALAAATLDDGALAHNGKLVVDRALVLAVYRNAY